MIMYCVIGEFPVSGSLQKLAKRLTGELRSHIQPMIAHDERLDSGVRKSPKRHFAFLY